MTRVVLLEVCVGGGDPGDVQDTRGCGALSRQAGAGGWVLPSTPWLLGVRAFPAMSRFSGTPSGKQRGSCPLCAPDLPVCMRTLVSQCDQEWVAFICTCVSLSLHSHVDALHTFPRDRLDPQTLDPAAPCKEGCALLLSLPCGSRPPFADGLH